MSTYYEKLKDPRWQRLRLEVMDAAGFTCSDCGADDKTLNVHHKIYRKGAEPWDYSEGDLECLCEDCHKQHHAQKTVLNELLVLTGGGDVAEICGYIAGMLMGESFIEVKVPDYEFAVGLGRYFGLKESQVIQAVGENNIVTMEALVALQRDKS